jgi:HEAT repeat protein
LHAELANPLVDFAAVEGLALRLGVTAVDPLLDCLETAQDQGTRAKLLKILGQLGPQVAQAAVSRLPRAPWYMQRNILVLLRSLRAWPEGFSPVSYALHPDQRVRREAYRLLLEFPQHRASTLNHGLADSDPGVVQIVLHAALESCPPETVKALERFLAAGRHPPELQAIAVRVLARLSGGEKAHPRIVKLAGERRFLRGWRLAPKSPVVLAALSVLAKHWSAHPEAADLLHLARVHPDPDYRLAAEARFA